jgi:hypothetical protein
MKNIWAVVLIFLSACATYHFGKGARVLPGGYDRVAIPMFSNKTHEVGIEPYFTEALRLEFERSHLATVTSVVDAQLIIEGTIISVTYAPGAPITSQATGLLTPVQLLGAYQNPPPGGTPLPAPQVPQINPLPVNSVLNSQYTVVVTVRLNARKASDHTVMWSSDFTGQRVYLSPLLGTPTLGDGTPATDTASPLYNQVSRTDTAAKIARDMMSEAHDRITENF